MANFLDVFEDVTKKGTKIPTDKYLKCGKYPIIDQGQSYISGYYDDEIGLFTDMPAIIFGDHTRVIKYIEQPCFLGADGVKLLKAKDKNFNYKYLYYVLCNAKIPNTGYNRHFKWLKELEIPIPPIEVQHQIAENLDKVTRTIDLCNAILEKLDLLVRARFVEMFGDTETNSNNYLIEKLSNLCTVSSSKRIYQNEQSSVGVPFLRISNLVELIGNGHFESDLFIPEEKYNELLENNLVPKAGDILVTSRGTLGKCYIVQDNDKFYFQDGMISWLYNLNKNITPLYLTLLFDTKDIKRQIDNLQSGSTVAYLSITMLKKLEIVIPPLELQNQFADFVKQTDKSKSAVKQVLEKAETLKKALMQEYFG